MHLRDGVPARQKDQDGSVSHCVTNVLHERENELKIDFIVVQVSESVKDVGRVLSLSFQSGNVGL